MTTFGLCLGCNTMKNLPTPDFCGNCYMELPTPPEESMVEDDYRFLVDMLGQPESIVGFFKTSIEQARKEGAENEREEMKDHWQVMRDKVFEKGKKEERTRLLGKIGELPENWSEERLKYNNESLGKLDERARIIELLQAINEEEK